jgi:hypothetical protein
MLADSYQDILRRVQRLTIAEQNQLIEDIKRILRSNNVEEPLHSILELEGLGMEVWKGVDVEKYIEEERNSWDG